MLKAFPYTMKTGLFIPGMSCLVMTLLLGAHDVSAQTEAAKYQQLENEIQTLRKQMETLEANHRREIDELKAMLQQKGNAVPSTVAVIPSAATNTTNTVNAPMEQDLYSSFKQKVVEALPKNTTLQGLDMDISAVLDLYFYHDTSSEGMAHLKEGLSGFGHHHAGDHDHEVYKNGFNLRHVELGFSAEVDPYFRAWTIVAVSEEGAEVEEAVLQTTCLPYGFMLSAGKLRSGIGRMNRQHSHTWDFVDQPLVYDVMFGHHGLNEVGAQVTWLAPTPFYWLFGAEVFNGDNEQSFAVAEDDALVEHNAPRLYTAFMKIGPELGEQHALLFGLSAVGGQHQVVEEALLKAADGYTLIYGTDFVYKYSGQRSHGEGDVVVQGEYFYRTMNLDGAGADWDGSDWEADQDGYYLQGLYGFLPRWRAGLRWDQVGVMNRVQEPYETRNVFGSSERASFVVDWKLSEFSLLRAQLGRGWYQTDEAREDAWEVLLQWQLTFGKHGAHDF